MNRTFLKSQLRRISALWPLQPSSEVLDEYARVLWGFTEGEIAAGFDHVIDTHVEPSAPKPGTIRAAVGQVAKARRQIPPSEAELVAANLSTLPPPAPDLEVILRWASEPENATAVEQQIDALVSSWDETARVQYRHVMRNTAARLCYDQAHRKLRVI